jgi:hypothetical protein
MTKFSVRRSDKVTSTRIKLYKLAINKVCPIDEFEKVIRRDSSLNLEIDKIYATLEDSCNLVLLPKTKFRQLRLGKLPYRLFEAKSKHLRFYLIKLEKAGRVILIGGCKTNQKADLKYLEVLIKDIHSQGIANLNNT